MLQAVSTLLRELRQSIIVCHNCHAAAALSTRRSRPYESPSGMLVSSGRGASVARSLLGGLEPNHDNLTRDRLEFTYAGARRCQVGRYGQNKHRLPDEGLGSVNL